MKWLFYLVCLAALLSCDITVAQIENWDFETGDLTGWTKTGTAFNASPTQNDQGGLFSGWNNQWYVNTWFSSEAAIGTLRSDTFKLTGTIDFRIAGWNHWPDVDPEFDHNYTVLKRASDNLELDRVWAPGQNAMTTSTPASVSIEMFLRITHSSSARK